MITKSTIYHGGDFHFYNEVADDYNVYLQIDKESCNRQQCQNISHYDQLMFL